MVIIKLPARILFSILCCYLFVNLELHSQSHDWQWIRGGGGIDAEGVNAVTTDLSGNIIVTGYYYSPKFFAGTDSLINAGNYDVFIIKYDPAGQVLWCRSAGGAYDDVGKGIATDLAGNIYVCGYFYSPVLSAGSVTVANAGAGDAFLLKYDPAGNLTDARAMGDTNDESANSVVCDANGNFYIAGYFQSAFLAAGPDTLYNSGSSDVFVLKGTSSAILWGRSLEGGASDLANGITVGPQGDVFLTGSFFSPFLTSGPDTLWGKGSSDIFTIAYTSAGTVKWLRGAGGQFNDSGHAVSADQSGNVFITGTFNSPALVAGNDTLAGQGSFDLVLARYDSLGTLQWSLSQGGVFDDTGYGITTDSQGQVYVTGHFHSPFIVFGTDTLHGAGIGDIYVSKYSSNGNCLWTRSMGGSADEGTSALYCDVNDNIICAGFFISPVLAAGADTLSCRGGEDIFVGKLKFQPLITGVERLENGKNSSIYPNPSSGILNVRSTEIVSQFEIFDMQGKRWSHQTPHRKEFVADLKGLPAGVYLVLLQWADGHTYHRLIVN